MTNTITYCEYATSEKDGEIKNKEDIRAADQRFRLLCIPFALWVMTKAFSAAIACPDLWGALQVKPD
jgi:hypothetical protein